MSRRQAAARSFRASASARRGSSCCRCWWCWSWSPAGRCCAPSISASPTPRSTNLGNAQWVGFRNYLEYVDYGNGAGEYFGLLADPALVERGLEHDPLHRHLGALETVLGLVVALVLNAEFKGRGLVRAAILDPLGDPDDRLGQDVGAG